MTITDGKSPELSRAWDQYLVKAVMDQTASNWPTRSEAEINAHKESANPGYECRLFVLPSPIAMYSDVKNVVVASVNGKELRIYPPFPVNEKKDASGAFSEIAIPEGLEAVEETTPIPDHAVTGVRAEHGLMPNAVWGRGLRIDAPSDVNVQVVIGSLLDHICQYTHQWWVRGTHNPFFGFQRLGAGVDRGFRTQKLFGYKDASKVESPWYGTVRFQPSLGAAALLTKTTWSQIAQHISQGHNADIGVLQIHEAVADYMAERDNKCILNLSIGVEILLNKHWQGVLNKSSNDKFDKIVRKTPLLDEKTKETLSKLIIDRGHVAHGRAPHVLATNSNYTIETYISAGKTVLEKYFAAIPDGAWPKLMTMRINRGV
jgi:hypothetical protein